MKSARGKGKEDLESQRKELVSNYIPIDFDAYSIEDKDTVLNKHRELEQNEKIWRISSLTAYVDDETKILLLPVAESKRNTKIMDTDYSMTKVGDLIESRDKAEQTIIGSTSEPTPTKRFEDKTQEEINDDIMKKR